MGGGPARPPGAIGVPAQERAERGWRTGGGGLVVAGRPLSSRLCAPGLTRGHAARPPPEAFAHRLARAVGRRARPIDRPFPLPGSIAARRPAPLRVQGAAALLPRSGAGLPPNAHLAQHRRGGGRALLMSAQTRPGGGGDGRRRAPRRARDTAPPQQRGAPGAPPPAPGPRHGIGGPYPRVRACNLGPQGVAIVRPWLDHRVRGGSHAPSPWAYGGGVLPLLAPGARAFTARVSRDASAAWGPTNFGHTRLIL